MKKSKTACPRSLSKPLFSEREIAGFLRKYFRQYPNIELAAILDLKLSRVRTICYSLGLKRIELEYFTSAQEKFLIRNYAKTGDVELAEIFQRRWPKQKHWTKKHIEKKRKYLGLKRTSEQVTAIHAKNVSAGRFKICPVKAWDKRERSREGDIRYWKTNAGKPLPVIKHKGRFVQWCRWAWETYYGTIPPGMKVVFKDANPYHLQPDNLVLLSNQELARDNSKKSSQGLSDNYVAGMLSYGDPQLRQLIKNDISLIETKRKQLILKRTIYGKERT